MKRWRGHVRDFRAQLAAWDLSLPGGAEDLLCEYARLLSSYEKANVIGTRDFDRVMLDQGYEV